MSLRLNSHGLFFSSDEFSEERNAFLHLCLAALFSRQRQHARMPLVLGVGIAEPSAAFRAVHGRRMIARLVVRRHCLTRALRALDLDFLFHCHLASLFYVVVVLSFLCTARYM